MIFSELHTLFDPEPHTGPLNMAIDEILLGEIPLPTLRVYRWREPTVSFGYFGAWEEAQEQWPNFPLVRRWTGGGVVPHGDDLTYTLVVPRSEPFATAAAGETYRLIHEAVRAALGATVQVSLAPAHAPKISAACFENPAQHDLIAAGEKIAGGAQRRTRHGLLHQGSIQISGLDWSFAHELANCLSGEPRERSPLASAQMDAAARLAGEKYASDAWLRRY